MGAFCTNCGTPLPEGAGFCPKCGTKVETFCCPSCGKELDFGADFCIYCGQRLKEEAPMAEPGQETSAPMEETTPQPEPKAPKEEKRSELAEEAPTSEAVGPTVEPPVDSESPKEGPSNPEGPQEFTWAQKKPQGRAGSAITTVRLRLEQEMLHIQKEFSDTITTHKNTLPEETIPLSEIESVYIQKRGMSVSVILLFLCVALVLYGGVSGKFDFGTTAFCLLGLAVIIALRYRGQMKRYQLVIVEKNTKRIVLEGDNPQTMDAAAEAILARAGIDPNTAPNRGGHKTIWIILGVAAVLLLGVLIVPELYLKQSFPAGVIQNQDVMYYVGTEISGDLDYQFATEVMGGKLVKNTAMPQYKDGLFTYYFVDCVYDVAVTTDNGESASGQVTVNCSFSVKPFNGRPEDIIFNSFTYSDELADELMTFMNERSSTLPDGLPMDFYLSGSAGNWSTSVTLYPDGSFSGGYSDMDMGAGVFYTNTFIGRFSDIKRMNDYTYVMTVSELNLEETPGEEWYSELGRMVATEPAGVEVGETFYLYLPQALMAELELPPEFMMNWYDGNGVTLGCFGLYGKTQDFGYMFSGEKVNTGNDTYGSDPGYAYDSDYILPTDTQYITEYDLYGLTKEEVVLARNEIYARYGYSFQSENIRVYFAAQPWYHEDTSINANTFGTAQMNDYERANLKTIQQYEKDMGWK